MPLEMNVDIVETEEEPSEKLAWKRPRPAATVKPGYKRGGKICT
jgi:hypothetical protein